MARTAQVDLKAALSVLLIWLAWRFVRRLAVVFSFIKTVTAVVCGLMFESNFDQLFLNFLAQIVQRHP